MYPEDSGGSGKLRVVAPVLISLFMLSIVPGTAVAQESVWTELAPATSPPGRGAHRMAYDGESDRIVLFGGWVGFESGSLDDTWAYDFNANTWRDMNPGTRPSPRGAHAMAYDAESDRVILFGGEIPETWAYDFNANTWTNMSPVVQPAAWYLVDMAYDVESDRIVLFGGCAGDSFFACFPDTKDETWAYDYNANTWTNMTPGTSPSPRVSPGMAYDVESDRIVLFGGCICPGFQNVLGDTWSYDFNANSWVEMNPQEAPPPEDTHGMAYDARSDRIIFGGGLHSSRTTWAYDFDRDTWTLTASGMGPSLRGAPGLAYDTESERMVLFGGLVGSSLSNLVPGDETWAHQLVSTPPPPWLLIAIGVVAAAVVAVVAIALTRRRRMRKGEGGE